jgi:hypothetical protein
MTERRHIKGFDRYNTPFMPQGLDSYIAPDNLVRAIDAYKLEAESQRNLELIWLVSGLRPTYRTIASFRVDHKKALIGVNAEESADKPSRF